MKNKCWWSHKWSKWEEDYRGVVKRFYTGKEHEVGTMIIQKRICLDCNLTERKKQQIEIDY